MYNHGTCKYRHQSYQLVSLLFSANFIAEESRHFFTWVYAAFSQKRSCHHQSSVQIEIRCFDWDIQYNRVSEPFSIPTPPPLFSQIFLFCVAVFSQKRENGTT